MPQLISRYLSLLMWTP